jgi:hypothetical protein
MSENPCPCKLTRGEILELNRENIVRLGEGGICNNLGEDGVTPCGRLLRDHPREGNKIDSITLFNISFVINLFHTIICHPQQVIN